MAYTLQDKKIRKKVMFFLLSFFLVLVGVFGYFHFQRNYHCLIWKTDEDNQIMIKPTTASEVSYFDKKTGAKYSYENPERKLVTIIYHDGAYQMSEILAK